MYALQICNHSLVHVFSLVLCSFFFRSPNMHRAHVPKPSIMSNRPRKRIGASCRRTSGVCRRLCNCRAQINAPIGMRSSSTAATTGAEETIGDVGGERRNRVLGCAPNTCAREHAICETSGVRGTCAPHHKHHVVGCFFFFLLRVSVHISASVNALAILFNIYTVDIVCTLWTFICIT